ncbi:Double-stranded RNA-binding domain protein [Kalmanozyma brasiliensis GHG001]|uniref:Uncharacterized protein n=1 Tax=Kalmanozyma brasiliensis (strain GHG001) TaxID=1365824 RepID=V5EUW5_KALBG|nr:Double-stranded RNA-binding domain protein [Kalmanozyma brasiliensis GHG001]EST06983.1 Double-stranded RNA-binding domain protein [Kalmanozyma brasiliensis GHG001]
MPKRSRDQADLEHGAHGHGDFPDAMVIAPSAPTEDDEERRKRQKLIDQISSQTAVDPADQLRSDQLAFVPRSYQLELAQLAKEGNVLVCLDTGSGKTLISVLLLQHVHQQHIPHSPSAPSPIRPKVSFFLVNLVPLVHQQSSVIAGNSTLSVGKLYGELKDTVRGKGYKLTTDSWREPQWSALLESHQVIVSTAQCFLDALIHGFVKMDDLNLLIFDEVHHALKNHPFFRIMKYYRLAPEKERPKIFGMTASPIFTSTGRFDEASRYLQKTMNARIHTVSKETLQELQEVKQKPDELVIEFAPYTTILDDLVAGVPMSALTQDMLSRFGKDPALGEDAVLDPATEHFEKEVRPKLEYTMRHLGPIGCDLLWYSTLLEFRSRARKWVSINRNRRTLVNDDWILDASMRTSITPPETQTPAESDSSDENPESQSSGSGLGLGLAIAHLSTHTELNARILQHMRSQPLLPDVLHFDSSNSSPKILRLLETLRCFAPSASSFCAIIFVERRQTVTLLVELIKRAPGLSFIHPEFLLGHENGSANGGALGMDWHDQVQVLNRFRRRKPTNLIVATSIAEEGLDIQAANLVIRFDLFNRHISFLQSRGRARARGSRFILMAETGNPEHAGVILNAFNTEANRATWLGDIADPDHDADFWDADWQQKLRIEAHEVEEECIYEPKTNARLFAEDAPTLVSHYAATLHSEYLRDAVLAYRLEAVEHGLGVPCTYKCTLELPSNAAVRSVESGEWRNKKQAKRAAAFKACQQLRELGELDEWLMPRMVDRTVLREVGVGSVNPHHKAWRGSGMPVQVPVKKMDGWARFCITAAPKKDEGDVWHATYLPLDGFSRGCQPIMLLTRGELPATQQLRLLCPKIGRMKDIDPKSLGALPPLSKEDVEAAKRFTRYVFKLIDRKDGGGRNGKGKNSPRAKFEPAVLIVPVRKLDGVTEVQTMNDLSIDLPSSLALSPLDLSKADQLEGRVLVRQHGFHSSALYAFQAVRADLTPNSPVDTTVTKPEGTVETYLSQHLKMYGRFHASNAVAPEDMHDVLTSELTDTPLLEVIKLSKPRNLLIPSSDKPPSNATRHIIPYFYLVHPLSFPLLSSIHLLPCILTRYDQLLLAQHCRTTLLPTLPTDIVLEALTSPSAGNPDYERLEFLGDTFLKLVATCHTFTTHLGRTEADLHMANKAILTNVRLLCEAKRVGLERWGLFESAGFAGKKFESPMVGSIGGALVHAQAEEGKWEGVKEKMLSDMVEALIGAGLTVSPTQALAVCRLFHLLPPTIVSLLSFNDLLSTLKSRSISESWQTRISRDGLDHLQSLFSHHYAYPHLALEAFTHPSLLGGLLPSYQRLEFLGDAWLDFFIVRTIYATHPDLSPGELTALKGVWASNATLSALGVRLGLHRFIASDSAVLQTTIATYVAALERQGKEGQYWTRIPHGTVVPKAIADVVEASFASIVVDSGFDEGTIAGVWDRIFLPFYEEFCRWDGLRVNEVRRVVEYVFATLRAGGRKVEVRSNLLDLPNLNEEEGETVVQALLTEVQVELCVGGKCVARVETLLRSVGHLQKAIGIARCLSEVQASILTHRGSGESSETEDEPIETTEVTERRDREAKMDEMEHLVLQLTRAVGWKCTFQSLSGEAGEEEVMSLAQLRGLILGDGEE